MLYVYILRMEQNLEIHIQVTLGVVAARFLEILYSTLVEIHTKIKVHTKWCGGFSNWSQKLIKKYLLFEISMIKFLTVFDDIFYWQGSFIWWLIHVITLLSQYVICYLITQVISFFLSLIDINEIIVYL